MTLENVIKQIDYWNKVKEIVEDTVKEHDSIETIIYKKYLEYENVSKVMKWLNEQGYRKVSEYNGKEIKYVTDDITDVLLKKDINVAVDLNELVKKLSTRNRKFYIS